MTGEDASQALQPHAMGGSGGGGHDRWRDEERERGLSRRPPGEGKIHAVVEP